MYGAANAQAYTDTFDIERLKQGALNLNKSVPVIQTMLNKDAINISNFQNYQLMTQTDNPSYMITDSSNYDDKSSGVRNEAIFYEYPLELPADIIALAKDYDWVYKYRAKSIVRATKSGDSMIADIAETAIAPSMFNPMYGVNVLGITRNTPLINDTQDSALDPQITDCSIRTLCALSKRANSSLGQARYKYADFMYCKDLGKVSNNHLITLRKFAHPIGDHIFEMSTPKMVAGSGEHSFQVEGDIGRLVSWFGTSENRLEDICKYSYHATWVNKDAGIEEQDSTADDETSGILGMLRNSFNPVYSTAVNNGQAGTHSIWGWMGSKLSTKALQGVGKNNGLLRNYDNNKVYTPKNTIQSTHLYEGKLEFSHEFTLTFSYQLRAYDNINPRSALMDLIGNILEVTYRRGKFWGGDRKLIGPPQDLGPFDKASEFIDNAFDKLGGFFNEWNNGSSHYDQIMGVLGRLKSSVLGQSFNIRDTTKLKELGGQLAGYIENLAKTSGWTEGFKGLLKNALGRPTLYAWQSILSGDDVGLWHVTIGNPRNPILSIGNLILTNATMQHSGPLGLDDFPTELKVIVTLKHARPRDVTEIGRMYTRGASSIYQHFGHHELKDFFGTGEAPQEGYTTKNEDGSTAEDVKGTYADSYKKDVASASKNTHIYKPELTNAGNVSNPFLSDGESIHIARTNNWSDTMFSVSIQEAA